MELPFVLFGALLAFAGVRLARDDERPAAIALAAAVVVGVHLVGPEFDFPIVEPGPVFRIGIVLAVGFAAWLSRGLLPDSLRPAVDGG
ncbi:MAG: hypothetical protein ACOCQU_04055 [Halolamina sp.]